MPKRWHIGPDVDVGICINGDRRLRLEYDKSKAYFDGSLAGQPGPKALRAAQQAGVKYYPLNGSSLSSRMRDEFFTPIHAVSGGGWSGEFFALPGGTVFAPSETTAPRTFFNRIDKPNTTPSAAVWRQNVGAILMQDPVLRFITAAALAAPVLRVLHREGFSLQITGNNAAGGEPLLHVAASIVGDPARKKAPYYESFDPEAPTFTTLRYEDLPIIIRDVDEVLAVSKLNEKDRLVSTFLKRTGATDNITSPKGLTGPAVRIFTAFRPIAHLHRRPHRPCSGVCRQIDYVGPRPRAVWLRRPAPRRLFVCQRARSASLGRGRPGLWGADAQVRAEAGPRVLRRPC